jgi:hypothetical protein
MNPTEIEHEGQKHTVEEWAEIYGLDTEDLLGRLRSNDYNLAKAICAQNKKNERLITWQGKTQNLKAWSEELGIPYYCLRSRLNCLRWTVQKAFTTPYGGER